MISWQMKQELRRQYGFRCGYCGLSEKQAGTELTVDHFKPQGAGGGDEWENLVYACGPCNHFKGAQWDPACPPVLHPQRDNLSAHIASAPRGYLQALTDAGARHLAALQLNRPTLVLRRRGIMPPRRPHSARRRQ